VSARPRRSNPEHSNPERSNPEHSNPERSNPERSNPNAACQRQRQSSVVGRRSTAKSCLT